LNPIGSVPRITNLAADRVEQILTPETLKKISQELKGDDKFYRLIVNVGVLLLRCDRVETLDNFVSKICLTRRARTETFNSIWRHYINADVHTEENIAFRLSLGKTTEYMHEYGAKKAAGSLISVSQSVSKAIIRHKIVPDELTVANLILLTLRLLPADLMALRKEVIREPISEAAKKVVKNTAEGPSSSYRDATSSSDSSTLFEDNIVYFSEELSDANQKNKKAEPTASHHDLTPTNTTELLPDISSIYGTPAAAHRRPIPVEKAHKAMREALSPLWDILKPMSGKLEERTLHTLLTAFNKSTLVLPTIHLLTHLNKYHDKPTVANSYAIGFATLCDDVQYEAVHEIFKKQLVDPETGQMFEFVRNSKSLLAAILQGISRAPAATAQEKDMIYALAVESRAMTPEALANYCYALARNGDVPSSRLYSLSELDTTHWKKHQLKYLNEIFWGLAMRGSLHLAHKVLELMWSRGSVISVRNLLAHLERCIHAEQSELVDKLMNYIRPSSTIKLHWANRGEVSATTSSALPIYVPLSDSLHNDLLDHYIKIGDGQGLKSSLQAYRAESGEMDPLVLLRRLLSKCAKNGKPDLAIMLLGAFADIGIDITVTEANLILKSFNRAKKADEAVKFFRSFSSHSIRPNEESFVELAYSRGIQSNTLLVLEVMDEMSAAGVRPNLLIYNTLITVLAPISLEHAEWVLQNMQDRGLTPNLESYSPLMRQYAKLGNQNMFQHHFDHIIHETNLPFDIHFCQVLLEEYTALGDFQAITEKLLPIMKRDDIQKDTRFLSTLAVSFCRFGRDDLADEVITKLPLKSSIQLRPRSINYVFTPIIEYLASQSLERTWRMIALMENKYGVAVGLNLYRTIMKVVSEQGTSEEKRTEAMNWISSHLHPEEFANLKKSLSTA
jgi:hypothetical protein